MLNESILSKNKKYIVGVSGGPDSMALLDMLRIKSYSIIACLVNYHKRSDSSLDYEVVHDYCIKHNIPLAYKEIFHYEKGNFQAQAREMRYDFYKEVAKLHNGDAVLLAHHFDDYLETVMMQKERKQEDGFWGILEMSKYEDLDVVRPLLNCRKIQLETYCQENSVDYRIDSSNLESDYRRNYFRNEVLKNYDENQKQQLYLEAVEHNEQYIKIMKYVSSWLNENFISMPTFKHCEYPTQVLKHFILNNTDIPMNKISKKLLENCIVALKKEGNVKINLPVNFVLIKEYDNVYVTKLTEDEHYCIIINQLEYKDYGYFKIMSQGNDRCGVDLKSSDFPITIRTYQAGDYIELSYGKKKLSRLFIDAKIPMHLRKRWPVILNSSQEIILVPKIGKNKEYLLAKPTWFVIQ